MVTVDLSWTDNSSNEDGFRVYRSTTTSPSFPSDYSKIHERNANTTTYSDTSAPIGTVYYAVTAFNSAGESGATTTSIETVTAPSTPQNLSFTDTATEDELSFSWDSVDWGGEQDSYQIYRAEASGATRSDYTQVATVAAGTTSYTDANLEDGERYFYRVGATNSAGDSDPSTEIDADTIVPAATNVSASATAPDSVDVTWSNSDDSSDGGIDVERSTDGFATVTTVASGLSPSTTEYTDTSVAEGTTYEFRVERNTDHATATSGTAQATTPIERFVTAEGTADATVSRTAPTARSATGAGAGDATVARTATPARSLTAESDRGAATVSRTTSDSRALTGDGSGDAGVSWVAPDAWKLPTSPGAATEILLTPSGLSTTYDELALTATVTEAKRELLDHYRRAGDVARQTTAFGAFRRIRRDGDDLLTVRPPDSVSPPFADRRVAPVDMTADQVAPRRHQLSLTLGLEEPRAREPIEGDDEAITVDTADLDLAGGETETVTLSWTPDGTQLGDWTATVSSETDSDSTLVTVSDAPWTFAWPVATLSLTEPRVGQVSRAGDAGLPTVTLPLRLDAAQVATLLAIGSRVDAVETRSVPDAGNTVVDTLPGDELTCTLAPPEASDIESGTYVLRDWSVEQARPAPPAYDATVTLVRDN